MQWHLNGCREAVIWSSKENLQRFIKQTKFRQYSSILSPAHFCPRTVGKYRTVVWWPPLNKLRTYLCRASSWPSRRPYAEIRRRALCHNAPDWLPSPCVACHWPCPAATAIAFQCSRIDSTVSRSSTVLQSAVQWWTQTASRRTELITHKQSAGACDKSVVWGNCRILAKGRCVWAAELHVSMVSVVAYCIKLTLKTLASNAGVFPWEVFLLGVEPLPRSEQAFLFWNYKGIAKTCYQSSNNQSVRTCKLYCIRYVAEWFFAFITHRQSTHKWINKYF